MNIYLIRHGKAEPASVNKKDRDRELTTEGIKSIIRSVNYWKKLKVNFDSIISSPYKRALQTAELIAQSFGYKNEIIKDSSLSPGSSTNAIINFATENNAEEIAFVGHQPDMGIHIAKFVCNDDLKIKFQPIALAKISFEAKPKIGRGTLIFLIPPI